MTTATLYLPGLPPRNLSVEDIALPNELGSIQVTARIAAELGCVPALVDTLDTGPGYSAFSIFDCEGAVNEAAMSALNLISQYGGYDVEDENTLLRGPILVITY
jgi:hypothetical protein